uniref:Uncharacterized protein n=1 Tax=Rhizophora mucronata TaxID=61149 RepID=A0A2P2PE00_RHIMU
MLLAKCTFSQIFIIKFIVFCCPHESRL